MEVTVLKRQSWDYTLQKNGERYMLSVVCGGAGLYEVEIELQEPLAKRVQESQALLDRIVADIRSRPEDFARLGVYADSSTDIP